MLAITEPRPIDLPRTVAALEARLVEAVSVFARLPGIEWPAGYRAHWPDVRRSWEDYNRTPEKTREGVPDPAAIDRAEEAMAWFSLLRNRDEQRLVVMRVGGRSFNMIAVYRFQFRFNRLPKKMDAEYLRRKYKDCLRKMLARLR